MCANPQSSGWHCGLTQVEKQTLGQLVSDTLDWCVALRPAPDLDQYAQTPALLAPRATFVTLRLHGALRGCMGTLAAETALFESVYRNTRSAAQEDPRFEPISAGERSALDFALSILSEAQTIATPADFHPGRHGLILAKHGCRAVFLPEVATEMGWTREETLSALCRKAGLPVSAWQEDTALAVFFTEHLSGEDLSHDR